ncbi:MAG: HAD hydrolase-like protein [Candidatus Babeliales bacterium]|nr:HAD hydrolase-like protein [Candidatus Babeliales bacterium]
MKNLIKISNLLYIKLAFLTIILYGMNIIYTKRLYRKYPKDTPMAEVTKDTIFVFDLHGVLFKLNPIEVVKEAIKVPHKFKLFSIIFYPHVIANAISSLYKGTVAEKIVINVDKKFPNLEFISSGLNILNAQSPIKQSIDIVSDLKKAGHKVYILSNIGEHSLDILKNKYPEIFSHFDGIMGTTPEDDYIQKPNPIAFEKYLVKFGHEKSKLIFIDDQMKNVISARNMGISSILFTTPYNLRRQLSI